MVWPGKRMYRGPGIPLAGECYPSLSLRFRNWALRRQMLVLVSRLAREL